MFVLSKNKWKTNIFIKYGINFLNYSQRKKNIVFIL